MSIEDLLKTLQQEYLASLPEKITRIHAQLEAAVTIEEIRDSFHKLKGTGRTYGLPEVSELAAVVENVCLSRPQMAVAAAGSALPILRDIHSARSLPQTPTFDLQNDSRFALIQSLLL